MGSDRRCGGLARDKESVDLLMKKVKGTFKISELTMTELSISLAANLIPDTVGIVAYTN